MARTKTVKALGSKVTIATRVLDPELACSSVMQLIAQAPVPPDELIQLDQEAKESAVVQALIAPRVIKDPVTIILDSAFDVKGDYLYLGLIKGKTRWFDIRLIEFSSTDCGKLSITASKASVKARDLLDMVV